MIPPGSVLGLLGGGQLGRMFTAEAVRMGYRVIVVDPDPHAPAATLAERHITRPWDDVEVIADLAANTVAITTEFENVPAHVLRALEAHRPVRPSADAVAITQDRLAEKSFLHECGVATAPWAPLTSALAVAAAWERIGGGPAILKTARLGYDGKGQAAVSSRAEASGAFERFGNVPCILERRVSLAVEISVMVARTVDGTVSSWPIAENTHHKGILHSSVVPARVSTAIAESAQAAAIQIATAMGYVGVLGVECFVTTDGAVLVNELAPRPHNSGHWTLDASMTSQFEQQVRILTELPLGDPQILSPVAMINLLGDLWEGGEPRWECALSIPGVRLHLYGKREARPGRKMGHLTALASDSDVALDAATRAWLALTA